MSSVIIPARIGSTRFPRKVLENIDGIPMIVRVAKQAMKSKADNVIITTDSTDVYNIVCDLEGINTVMSDSNIQTGQDRVAQVAMTIDDDIVINLQGDEPFISPTIINDLIDGLEENITINMITAITDFKSGQDILNPSYVKVVADKNMFALYFSRSVIPYNRDNIPDINYYKHIGIYGYRKSFLIELSAMERSSLEISESLEQLRAIENGYKIKLVKTDYQPLSVDTQEDLLIAERYAKSINK